MTRMAGGDRLRDLRSAGTRVDMAQKESKKLASDSIVLRVTLTWDPAKEHKRAALAQVLLHMGEGLANGHTAGKLPNRGSWQLGEGQNLIDGRRS